jgi:predicted phage gp36 major capsid-like protein
LRGQENISAKDEKRAGVLEKSGAKTANSLLKKEMAIDRHSQKADEARAAREEENEARARIGKKAKVEGFGERWHRVRAEQLDERAVAGASPKSATDLGVKTENLPT